MTRYITTALLSAMAMAAMTASAAADTRIDCPLPQVTRKITDNLPSGWWTTPVSNRLTETKVMSVGGKPTLLCLYGSSGSIQREAPAGRQCRAVTGGFTCSGKTLQAPAPSVQIAPQQPVQPAPQQAGPVTFSTGALSVRQTHLFDLDRGVLDQRPTADIWFQAKSAQELFLTPRNGAAMSVSGARNRGKAGCAGGRYSGGSLPLAKLPVGTYICVKTNEKRISEFRINGLSKGTLSLGYTTWQ